MKKKIATIVVIIIAILFYGVYLAFFDMARLKGEFISEVKSPNGTYTVKSYLSNGGATTGYAILGELNYNKVNKKPKNIYWNYREEKADIEWTDEVTVIINGHKVNILHDTFDFRREK